jgi:uncharacterized protein YndB with AHSA1/START domain
MSERTVQLTFWIHASPRRVWKALTSGGELARWYTTPHRLELRKGGRWEFLDGKLGGRILEVVPGQKLVQMYRLIPGEPETRVRYELADRKGRTELTLLHDRFGAAKETFRCATEPAVWPWILSNLKTYVETGKPMRERAFS